MISLHNARFTSLALLVSLVAAPFMVPTPALGANRMAVRAMQRGMQRRTLEYGFSLVDLIADNPWKSGLVAGGVTALLIYLLSKPVRKKVNKGFAYVGGGFKKVGEGASSLSHQAKFQWNKRISRYSDAEIEELNKKYDAAEAGLKGLQANVSNATTAFDHANENRRSFTDKRPYNEKLLAGMPGVVNDSTHMESKEIASLIADYVMSKESLQDEERRLRSEWAVAAHNLSAAQKAFKDEEAKRNEYDELRKSIAQRRGCRVEDLQQCNEKLRAVATELTEIEARMDAQTKAKKQINQTDGERHEELLKEQAKLEKELKEKQDERDRLINRTKKQAVAPQIPVPDQVPAHSMSQAHSGAAGSAVTESRDTQAVNSEQPDSISKMLAASASSSTFSSSSSAAVGSSSAH